MNSVLILLRAIGACVLDSSVLLQCNATLMTMETCRCFYLWHPQAIAIAAEIACWQLLKHNRSISGNANN